MGEHITQEVSSGGNLNSCTVRDVLLGGTAGRLPGIKTVIIITQFVLILYLLLTPYGGIKKEIVHAINEASLEDNRLSPEEQQFVSAQHKEILDRVVIIEKMLYDVTRDFASYREAASVLRYKLAEESKQEVIKEIREHCR